MLLVPENSPGFYDCCLLTPGSSSQQQCSEGQRYAPVHIRLSLAVTFLFSEELCPRPYTGPSEVTAGGWQGAARTGQMLWCEGSGQGVRWSFLRVWCVQEAPMHLRSTVLHCVGFFPPCTSVSYCLTVWVVRINRVIVFNPTHNSLRSCLYIKIPIVVTGGEVVNGWLASVKSDVNSVSVYFCG